MNILLGLTIGLIILLAGGQAVVFGAVRVARRFGMSEFFIGVVLIGFGTSMPELMTSVHAALGGSPGIAFGNVVGSNIANILFILGVTAFVFPITSDQTVSNRDIILLAVLTVLFVIVSMILPLSRPVAFLYVVGICCYVYLLHHGEKGGTSTHKEDQQTAFLQKYGVWVDSGIAISGIVGLVYGAHLLVDASVSLARLVGMSETIIGLTIVALGTSLPELTASLLSAQKGKSGLALGNVIGSNIYNLFGILGITGLFAPTVVPLDIAWVYNPVMLCVTFVFAYILWEYKSISSKFGKWFLYGYGVYVLFTASLALAS